MAGANLRVFLVGAIKPAHARAFMATSQFQYTHKAALDKWLTELLGPRMPRNQDKPRLVRPCQHTSPGSGQS